MAPSGQAHSAPGSVKGKEITSAQQMTCSAGRRPDNLAPATYDKAAQPMAANSSRSAQCKLSPAVPERHSANAMTKALPKLAQTQKPLDGRCRCAHAPKAAVLRGSTPSNTLACTASTCRMAMEVNSGKPNTAPAAVAPIRGQSLRAGRGAFWTFSNSTLSRPATAARPMAMNRPGSCGSATEPVAKRVMGSVSEKITTPSKPRPRPQVDGVMRCATRRSQALTARSKRSKPRSRPRPPPCSG